MNYLNGLNLQGFPSFSPDVKGCQRPNVGKGGYNSATGSVFTQAARIDASKGLQEYAYTHPETQTESKEQPKPDTSTINYDVKRGEYWYNIVKDQYGVSDHKTIMAIVRQLKKTNGVKNRLSPIMPKNIKLPAKIDLGKDRTFSIKQKPQAPLDQKIGTESIPDDMDAPQDESVTSSESQEVVSNSSGNSTGITPTSTVTQTTQPSSSENLPENYWDPDTEVDEVLAQEPQHSQTRGDIIMSHLERSANENGTTLNQMLEGILGTDNAPETVAEQSQAGEQQSPRGVSRNSSQVLKSF